MLAVFVIPNRLLCLIHTILIFDIVAIEDSLCFFVGHSVFQGDYIPSKPSCSSLPSNRVSGDL